jgi:hypothetical protein
MKYRTKRCYEGSWMNDMREGPGFEIYSNGNIYVGKFKEGKANGQGTYTSKNGLETYTGEWLKGVKNGKGKWQRTEKTKVEEAIKNNKFANLKGGKKKAIVKVTIKDSVYEEYDGDWKDGKSEGSGTYLKKDYFMKEQLREGYFEEVYTG